MSKKSHSIFILSIILILVYAFRYGLGLWEFAFSFGYTITALFMVIWGDAFINWFYSRGVRRFFILLMTFLALYNFSFWVHQKNSACLINAGVFLFSSAFYIAYDLFFEWKRLRNTQNE